MSEFAANSNNSSRRGSSFDIHSKACISEEFDDNESKSSMPRMSAKYRIVKDDDNGVGVAVGVGVLVVVDVLAGYIVGPSDGGIDEENVVGLSSSPLLPSSSIKYSTSVIMKAVNEQIAKKQIVTKSILFVYF